jgi:hypothetical protein
MPEGFPALLIEGRLRNSIFLFFVRSKIGTKEKNQETIKWVNATANRSREKLGDPATVDARCGSELTAESDCESHRTMAGDRHQQTGITDSDKSW